MDLPIDDERTVTLRKPITLGETEYTELHLREPTASELAKAMKADGEIEMMMTLINLTAAVPKGVVERLSQRDLMECSRFFVQFSRVESPSEK